MLKNCDYTEARDLLLKSVRPTESEFAPLDDCAGRILAEQVTARTDVPPFDRSPYDGYAFRSADTASASPEHPVTLRVLEEIPAGHMWSVPVTPGTASKMMTGAPIPDGADTVCMFEKTEFTADTVTLSHPCQAGDNVVRRGEDVTAGTVLAEVGTEIDGPLAGTLAAQGITAPRVFRRVKVGVITTGSELAEAGETLSPGKIVNTNRYTFLSELRRQGMEAKFFGEPADDVADIAAKIENALSACDAVLVTGGVSVGDFDLTPAALEAIGAELLVQNVTLKPGGKCCYALREGKLLCCLSGNPASSLTNFYAVALAALRKLCGFAHPMLRELSVALAEPFPKKSPQTRLLRGRLLLTAGRAEISVPSAQGNSVLSTMVGCDLLAVVPAGSARLGAGTVLSAYLLP